MQLFEFLFLITLAVAIARILAGTKYAWLRYSGIVGVGFVVLLLGLAMDGWRWRWQMFPACIGLALVALGSLKRSNTRLIWRLPAAVALTVLVGSSALLAQLMPIVTLPAPSGPYGVGTFDFSITDPSRIERYAPARKRELYVEVWYPAASASVDTHSVRTLFHDLYAGDFNRTSLLFGYLRQVDTHSHVQAPIAESDEGAFPVLLFNHALDFGFTSQNLLLMEHLASHGYVIFSIAHPYQTAKVNLADAGTVFRASGLPADIVLPQAETDMGIVGTVFDATADITKISALKASLLPLAELYLAAKEADRADLLEQFINSPQFAPFTQFATRELLEDFIYYDHMADSSLTQYWVEDNQFIADSLADLRAPVAGFAEALDLERMGVFGMSFGGAAAGEFCKIDSRCDAGANLDGTQSGEHWSRRLPVPFLMFYNDVHQGGNDFAYLPPAADFWDYRVKGSTHTDFTDFVYLWPVLKTVGFAGSVDGMRMMEIVNTVQLNFFDYYLKGSAIPGELFTDIPEIVVRQHAGAGH